MPVFKKKRRSKSKPSKKKISKEKINKKIEKKIEEIKTQPKENKNPMCGFCKGNLIKVDAVNKDYVCEKCNRGVTFMEE